MKLYLVISLILYFLIYTVYSAFDDETKRLFKIQMLQEGDNLRFAKPGNKVKLHFTGYFSETRRKFDSSQADPITILIGRGQMIECWERLIPRISVGEKVSFVCPHSLAYGLTGVKGKVPPKMNLAYEVEIVDVIEGNYEEL
jgi:FKBP-type peptidyl-prolyl cis-trans isomerase